MESRHWGTGSEMQVFFAGRYGFFALLRLAAIPAWRWLRRKTGADRSQLRTSRPLFGLLHIDAASRRSVLSTGTT